MNGDSSGGGPVLGYVDSIAREGATEPCINCSGRRVWKNTAALLYEGLQWQYYYCYECRRWWKRHSKYRYLVSPIVDGRIANNLVWRLESDREMLEVGLENNATVRRGLARGWRTIVKVVHSLSRR